MGFFCCVLLIAYQAGSTQRDSHKGRMKRLDYLTRAFCVFCVHLLSQGNA